MESTRSTSAGDVHLTMANVQKANAYHIDRSSTAFVHQCHLRNDVLSVAMASQEARNMYLVARSGQRAH